MSRFWFRCVGDHCGRTRPQASADFRCSDCGDILSIEQSQPVLPAKELKATFLQRRLSNDPCDRSGVWRFREFLPFTGYAACHAVTLGEGNTPLLAAPRSAEYAGVRQLSVKHLGWNPTGSFKDYGMTVAVTEASRLHARGVACASTGNTSASMAAYAAQAGLPAVVFIPSGQISLGKLCQALDYGAHTIQVDGDFDAALALVRQLSPELGLYLVNSINPFRVEGQKTVIPELLEQLDWEIPDRILLPGGNLGNSAAFGKALYELYHWGWIDRLPKLTVVQAEGAAPFQRMWATQAETLTPEVAQTRATAIQIGNPVSWSKALNALRATDGDCIAVSDQMIADAKALLGRDGIGCEPASATALAGLRQLTLQGVVSPEEKVVAILTGHLLKDSAFTLDYYEERLKDGRGNPINTQFQNRPVAVDADPASVRAAIEEFL